MRLRKVKHAKDYIDKYTEYIIPNPEAYKGKWNTLFKNDHPIEIEIGCGKGKFVYEKALINPNINFIGIEKFDSVVVRALEKLIENPLPNVVLLRIDANKIDTVFASGEVNKIYLNFSDPWPKNSHAKRRLTSELFLDRYKLVLKNKSIIEMKTDNFGLFQYSILSFNKHDNYIIKDINLNLYNVEPVDNIQTEFEMKFVEQGNLIFKQVVRYESE